MPSIASTLVYEAPTGRPRPLVLRPDAGDSAPHAGRLGSWAEPWRDTARMCELVRPSPSPGTGLRLVHSVIAYSLPFIFDI